MTFLWSPLAQLSTISDPLRGMKSLFCRMTLKHVSVFGNPSPTISLWEYRGLIADLQIWIFLIKLHNGSVRLTLSCDYLCLCFSKLLTASSVCSKHCSFIWPPTYIWFSFNCNVQSLVFDWNWAGAQARRVVTPQLWVEMLMTVGLHWVTFFWWLLSDTKQHSNEPINISCCMQTQTAKFIFLFVEIMLISFSHLWRKYWENLTVIWSYRIFKWDYEDDDDDSILLCV